MHDFIFKNNIYNKVVTELFILYTYDLILTLIIYLIKK